MIVDEYRVLTEAIERGVAYGITRAFKHWDRPAMTEDEVREHADRIVDAVLGEMCDWFRFDDDGRGEPIRTADDDELL